MILNAFYKAAVEDEYKAAQYKRSELQYWDNTQEIDSALIAALDINRNAILSQWPDQNLKNNTYTPVDAKLNALLLYISPQSANNRHDLCPQTGDRPVIERIKKYEADFGRYLKIEDWDGISDRLLASTWIGDFCEDTNYSVSLDAYTRRGFLWNHPEWSSGNVPIDDNLCDPDGESFMEMFYRDNLHEFISELSNPDFGIKTGFICHNGPYHCKTNNPTKFNDPEHFQKEYFRIQFAENPDFPRLNSHLENIQNRHNWGADNVANGYASSPGYLGYQIPGQGWLNYDFYLADYRGADYKYGSIFSTPPGEVDLESGYEDSMIMSAPQFLGARGLYGGVSVEYRPSYNNLNCKFNDLPSIISALDNSSEIPPGGNNLLYRIDKMAADYRHTHLPRKISLMETFKLPHLENVHMFRSEIWPPRIFQNGVGATSYPTGNHDFSQPIITIEEQEKDGIEGFFNIDKVGFAPIEAAIAHDYVVMQDGANAYIPYTFWHAYFKPSSFDHDGQLNFWVTGPKDIYWSFYGGHHLNEPVPRPGSSNGSKLERAFESYRADLAHTFTYGSRMAIFDVDRAVDKNGYEYEDDPPGTSGDWIITDFVSENTADSSENFFRHLLSRYNAWGWPSTEDCVADSLFFGTLQKPLELVMTEIPPEFDRSLLIDFETNLDEKINMNINLEFHSPAVLTSFWKTDISDPITQQPGKKREKLDSTENQRLLFVLTNFTDINDGTGGRSYTVRTSKIDLTQLLPNPGGYYYKFYYQPGVHLQQTLELINPSGENPPSEFSFDETVEGNSTTLVGILTTDYIILDGSFGLINQDENLDCLIHDKTTGELSVVFGDGSMSYNEEDSEFIAAGIKAFGFCHCDTDEQGQLVLLTENGIQLVKYDESGFHLVFSEDDVFADAIAMKKLSSEDKEDKFIIQDGDELKSLSISSDKSERSIIVITEIQSEPVRSFELGNLCGDNIKDLALISSEGAVELITFENGIPESQVIIEINTSADTILFDDTDLDTDLDIVLQSASTKSEETLEWISGWKFVPGKH